AVVIAYLADVPWGKQPVALSIDLRDQNRALVRFEPPATDKVRKAELVLTLSEGLKMVPPRPFEMGVYETLERWDEATVTWTNQPRFAERPALTVRVDPKAKELRIDVTALVAKDPRGHGWLLKVAQPLAEPEPVTLKPFRRPVDAP